MTGPVVRVERAYSHSAERVFDAFVDPATAGRFLFRTDDGELVTCELDVRVGGKWVISERRAQDVIVHHGEYLEIDRPRRLVFTFGVEGHGTPDPVTVEIEAKGSGCRLVLTHQMQAEWAEWKDRTEHGWGMILDRLTGLLG